MRPLRLRQSFFSRRADRITGKRHLLPLHTHLTPRSLRCELLEDRRMLAISPYPELPGMVLVTPRPDQFEDQIIYLDFDGAEDVTYNGPVVVEDIDVPAFEAPQIGGAGAADHRVGCNQAGGNVRGHGPDIHD